MALWDIKERYDIVRSNQIRPGDILYGGGSTGSSSNIIDIISITTIGDAVDFGDLTRSTSSTSGTGNKIRAFVAGGDPQVNTIDAMIFKSKGNSSDFGNLTNTVNRLGASGNNIRGIFGGGESPEHASGYTNTIGFLTLTTEGNASDFGDLSSRRSDVTAAASPTRLVFGGGLEAPGKQDQLQFVTIASTGNTSDFGDLTSARSVPAGVSSTTKALYGGGDTGSVVNTIDTITIATTGNATDFGDLTAVRKRLGGDSNNTKAVFLGGNTVNDAATPTNIIDFVTIASTGDAADFGDLTSARLGGGSASNSHGGLGEDEDYFFQRPSVTYMPGSGKTLICGGQLSPGDGTVDIDTYNIPTLGNARNFGDLSKTASNGVGSASSYTRAVFSSGYYFTSPYYSTEMQAIEFATEGNVCDFGDTTQERYGMAYGNVGNTTRGLFMGGYAPSSPYIVNIIDYITIATMGNAADFGDLTNVKQSPAAASNNTRGINFGGTTPSNINIIDYVTIASTGNALDFGDSSVTRSNYAGAASTVRAVAAGGGAPGVSDVIDYVTIASTGDASDFGDLTQAGKAACPGSNGTRAVFAGRHTPGKQTTMDYITIASTGDAADFGDLKVAASEKGSASDSHGGLQN